MKIEHITSHNRDYYWITDASGATVELSPQDALLALQFLYERLDDIMRQSVWRAGP